MDDSIIRLSSLPIYFISLSDKLGIGMCVREALYENRALSARSILSASPMCSFYESLHRTMSLIRSVSLIIEEQRAGETRAVNMLMESFPEDYPFRSSSGSR